MREQLSDTVADIVEEIKELLREVPARNKQEMKSVIELISEEIDSIDANEIFCELQMTDVEEDYDYAEVCNERAERLIDKLKN